MLRSDGKNNRLLLLWQAAVKLEGSDIERMIIDARQKRSQTLSILKTSSKSNGSDKCAPIVKNSHNEIERTRRAHLRKCMEDLKKKLVFNNEYNFSRITMLNVLRKAAVTIRARERTIRSLYHEEGEAKTNNTHLKQRLSNLERQIAVLSHRRNHSSHNQHRSYSFNQRQRYHQHQHHNSHLQHIHYHKMGQAEFVDKRIRNCSECSIITTSSEESQALEESIANTLGINICTKSSNNNNNNNNNSSTNNKVIQNYHHRHRHLYQAKQQQQQQPQHHNHEAGGNIIKSPCKLLHPTISNATLSPIATNNTNDNITTSTSTATDNSITKIVSNPKSINGNAAPNCYSPISTSSDSGFDDFSNNFRPVINKRQLIMSTSGEDIRIS